MARYIVPAEMPKSCAHCHFSALKYQHPFFSKEKPNTKGYFCPFAGLTLELDFYDYTTKADWCPLVAIEDTADVVPKSEVEELTGKFECFLCHVTGGRLSKHTYDLGTMETVATDCINETYNDGYGEGYKDCAREIFEEIESMLIRYTFEDDYISLGITDELAELKKKYTEGNDG